MDLGIPMDPATDVPENRRISNMKKIIMVSGGFDPVHIGHVRMFKEAKQFGDQVVVGLNSDEWLSRKKGKPFMPFEERKEILEAMQYIDYVYSFDDSDDTACDFIRKVSQFYMTDTETELYFANGGDRTNNTTPEMSYCKGRGIKLLWDVGGGKIQSSSVLTGVKA